MYGNQLPRISSPIGDILVLRFPVMTSNDSNVEEAFITYKSRALETLSRKDYGLFAYFPTY